MKNHPVTEVVFYSTARFGICNFFLCPYPFALMLSRVHYCCRFDRYKKLGPLLLLLLHSCLSFFYSRKTSPPFFKLSDTALFIFCTFKINMCNVFYLLFRDNLIMDHCLIFYHFFDFLIYDIVNNTYVL